MGKLAHLLVPLFSRAGQVMLRAVQDDRTAGDVAYFLDRGSEFSLDQGRRGSWTKDAGLQFVREAVSGESEQTVFLSRDKVAGKHTPKRIVARAAGKDVR